MQIDDSIGQLTAGITDGKIKGRRVIKRKINVLTGKRFNDRLAGGGIAGDFGAFNSQVSSAGASVTAIGGRKCLINGIDLTV